MITGICACKEIMLGFADFDSKKYIYLVRGMKQEILSKIKVPTMLYKESTGSVIDF